MKNKLLTLAAALTLVVMVGKFLAVPLLAQARAALVQNVDERGRTPYQSTRDMNTCAGSTNCQLTFGAVPNNKRLVITHFDTLVTVSGSGSLQDIFLSVGGTPDRANPEFTASLPGAGGFNSFISSREVLFYLDAGGASPTVDLQATNGMFGIVTLRGYLVDCTNGCAAIAH